MEVEVEVLFGSEDVRFLNCYALIKGNFWSFGYIFLTTSDQVR